MALVGWTSANYLTRTTGLPGTANYTWMAWARWGAGAGYRVLFRRAGDKWLVMVNGSNVLIFWDGTVETTGPTIVPGRDYHVAATRSGNDQIVYLDGVSVITKTSVVNFAADDLWIGNDGSSEALVGGRVEAVKFWEATLSPAEVAAEIGYYRPVRKTNVWGMWSFWLDKSDESGLGHEWTQVGTALARSTEPPTPTIANYPPNPAPEIFNYVGEA